MKNFLFIFLTLMTPLSVEAQLLNPSIGLFNPPLLSDSICLIPIYTGSFDNSGLQVGDTVPDFTLFDVNGDSLNLLHTIQNGKPVLLIAGSYTCPVYRGKVAKINQLDSMYNGQLEIIVVYTVEAHPDIDISPYSGTVWTTAQNQTQGILYQQPKTYGERVGIINDMLSAIPHSIPVLIDGPCNEWWSVFGPAPNNSYLIDTNGIVFSKHGWFDKAPSDIDCDIDSLLNNNSCGTQTMNGTFSVQYNGSNTAIGNPGDILFDYANIINNSQGQAEIMIIRYQNNIPLGWNTAMCVDICLPTWVDTTFLTLAPQNTQPFTMYFYTDSVPGAGMSTIRFINLNVTGNNTQKYFYASTLSTGVQQYTGDQNQFTIYPNPFYQSLNINTTLPTTNLYVQLMNSIGQVILHEGFKNEINFELMDLAPGLYYLCISDNTSMIYKQKLIKF